MIVTAWTNGTSGFGVKINAPDRDKYFDRSWKTVMLELEGTGAEIPINIDKPSFWSETCRELISSEIGKWFAANKMVPWTKGHPPKFLLEPTSPRRFKLRKLK